MKKMIALTLGLSLVGYNASADHQTQTRSSCVGLPKYKAVAKLKWPNDTFYTNNTDTGCGYANAEIKSDWNSPDPDGWSYCHNGNDGFWAGGTGRNGFQYGSNTTLLESVYSYAPKITAKDFQENVVTTNGYKGDGIIFNAADRTVTIQNLTAYLNVASSDLKNDYSILNFKIFSEVVKDGISIPVQTLWNASVSIVNGELLLDGDFSKNDFANHSKGNNISYTLDKTTKVIQIADDVDFESLVVEMSGHGGNLAEGIPENFAPNFASADGQAIKNNMLAGTNFNFDILNKSKEIEISVTKNVIDSKIVEANILTINGEKVKSIDLNASNIQTVNVNDLPKGAYYVRYLIDGNYYSKKFIL